MQLKGALDLARVSHGGKPARAAAGEMRIVTSLSCGLRGGAALGETPAADVSALLRVISAVTAPLMEDAADAGGMVSPFEGESFAAHWNAARDDPEHAARACEAASRMTATLAMLNERLAREDASHAHSFEPVEIDIGISTGPAVIAGGLASRGRTNCAVIGANIVLAARLRTLADRYAYAVIVSAATREAASRDLAFLELDFLALGPGETPIKPYAMLGNPLTHANPKFRALATFHERIFEAVRAQQWNEARRLIDQCRKLSGASRKFYDLHLARIAWFEAHPPGGDWDGAFRAPVV